MAEIEENEQLKSEFGKGTITPAGQGEGTGGIWGPHEGVYGQMSILN